VLDQVLLSDRTRFHLHRILVGGAGILYLKGERADPFAVEADVLFYSLWGMGSRHDHLDPSTLRCARGGAVHTGCRSPVGDDVEAGGGAVDMGRLAAFAGAVLNVVKPLQTALAKLRRLREQLCTSLPGCCLVFPLGSPGIRWLGQEGNSRKPTSY
jgi:hypothetical protein